MSYTIYFSKSQGPYVGAAKLSAIKSEQLMMYFIKNYGLHPVAPKDPNNIVRWMLKGFNGTLKVTVTYYRTGTINVDNLEVKEIVL